MKSTPKVLIIEDESVIRYALRRLLERNQFKVSEAGSVAEAQTKQNLDEFDIIISDLRLPGAPGTDLIKLAPATPVLIMTSYASLRSAVDAMKMGAVDYIAKPFDHNEMLGTIRRIIASHTPPPVAAVGGSHGLPGMVGRSPAMQAIYSHIHKVARTATTALIQGESGTGKELIAKAIHALGPRRDQPLISINCAAIPESLIESELFGHEKGAFTGATASRTGLVEAADGGTLFLDEIGELPLEAQARLLRVLQEGEIRRIGSVESKKVDVRLISATHRDLARMVKENRFRQDLYYRINVVKIELPPLRERGSDILEIAEHILDKVAQRLGRSALRFSPNAIQAITTYGWPGNVRELENAIERAVVLSEQPVIDHPLLGIDVELIEVAELRRQQESKGTVPSKIAFEPQEGLSLEDYFQQFVLQHQDQMSETELARKLGISRKCLWERRQRFSIPRSRTPAKRAG